MQSPNPNTRRNYLLTCPRTCSTLLLQILNISQQPSLPAANVQNSYFFLPTYFANIESLHTHGVHIGEWSEEQRTILMQTHQSCYQNLCKVLDETAEQGQSTYIKEHVPWIMEPVAKTKLLFGDDSTNEAPWKAEMPGSVALRTPGNLTLFSDAFLETWQPTFLIRHPALIYPSFIRAFQEMEGGWDCAMLTKLCTFHWSRTLYDWYQANPHTDSPIILDADDIILHPSYLVDYAKLVGLDPSKLAFEWEQTGKPDVDEKNLSAERMARMRDTMWQSKGILKDKTAVGLDLEMEAEKWKVEFGEERSGELEDVVRKAMPDYLYSKERRMRPEVVVGAE